MEVEFEGTENVDYYGVQQLVPVTPHREYVLVFRAKSREISTEQGLFFEVVGEGVGAQTEMILGTTDWTEYSVWFRVPEQTEVVTIRLRRRPSKRIDNKLRGMFVVDWVRVKAADSADRGR